MAPDLRHINPLKKLVADTVFDAVMGLDAATGPDPNVDFVSVRRLSDLRTEVEIHLKMSYVPPRQFTVLVIEHR